jgi:hypothetical protein
MTGTGATMSTGEQHAMERVDAMADRLARVETKLDLLVEQIAPQRLDHEARIRTLEQRAWMLAGFAAAPGVVALLGNVLGGGAPQ